MGEKLIIRYDKIGDFLFIELCRPYAEQDSDMVDDAVVARFNLTTGDMESVEVLFFDSWLKKEGAIRIPVSAAMWSANTTPPSVVAPSSMDSHLTIKYDLSGDILTLEQRPLHTGQRPGEICEGVSGRFNPETGEIECLEIRRFKSRTGNDGEIVLPINATLRLVKSAVAAD